ncbi:MAG: lipid-A-disaccharide synthase [Muribaculaceae bacterium]|nr:lipid-A-disaccharide synthase [Muribaculaceae bacterium]
MKYFLIAGEASGDLHAGGLMQALAAADPEATFTFLGGDLMAAAAGHSPVVHYRDMAFMGFSEVLRNLGKISTNLRIARKTLLEERPDCLILIDYPSFNLKVAKTAARAGIPVFWYISPKVWAWKSWRVKDIRKLVGKVLCILPFEPEFYRSRGYDKAVYVGNPSVEEIDAALASTGTREDFARRHHLRENRPFIALLPGSRRGEIRCNLPVMDAVARQFPGYTIVVAGAPSVPDEVYNGLTKFAVVRDSTHELLAHAHAALVTSGTATLEAALAGVPQVVTYRSNGSRLAYNIMKKLLKVKFVSLPNLIVSREIIPEMLLHNCTPELVTERLRAITPESSPARAAQIEGYAEMRRILGPSGAASRAASAIISSLKKG